jgi:hypothetical protein
MGQQPTNVFSALCCLSQCSLHCRVERTEEPRPVPVGQRGWPAGVCPQLPQVSGYFTTGKRIADIRFRPVFSGWRDDAGTSFEAP